MALLTGLLEFLGRHATRAMFVSVFVALALPGLAEQAQVWLIPGLIIPLVIALMRLDWAAVLRYGRRVWLVAGLTLWFTTATPVLVALVTLPLGLPAGIRAGLVLMAAAPPLVSAPVLALIFGLDAAIAVVVVVTATLAVPFTLPPLALGLLGLDVNLPIGALMLRLGLLVGAPFVIALAIRWLVPAAWIAANSRRLDGVSVLSLGGFALGIMAGVTDLIIADPLYVLATAGLAFAANLTLQAAGALLAWRLGRPAALTIGLATGCRNMGLVLVSLAGSADPAILFYFAMAQFPMYMLPILTGPLYRRIMRRDAAAGAAPGG